jgi:hypothetical protein
LVSHGELSGTVSDQSGRTLAGVKITLNDPSRGLEFHAESGAEGRFRLALLPPSVYQLTAEGRGFATLVEDGIEVRVGDHVVVDCQLSNEPRIQVEVTARAPTIDFQRTSQASFLGSRHLDQLPINRRNYLDFTLLTPGVVDTAGAADQAAFRVPTTPDSGLGFSGGNGRGSIFSVDGFSNNGTTGNVRPSLPQNAVQEFQVQRMGYSAELGGGYSGAINVVSRSGTNEFHGSVFAFLRNRAFQARNFFDPGKSAYTRVQSGAALGGPVRKDRTFFYGSFERLDRHETTFVPILENKAALSQLKPSQTALIGFLSGSSDPQYAALGASLPALLTPSNNPMVPLLFRANSGVFPFSAGMTQASIRLDHRFSPKDMILLRANLTDDSEQNTHFGALTGFSRGSSAYTPDRTIGAQYTRLISPQWSWLTRASFSYSRLLFRPNDAKGPAIDINGFGNFGRDPQFPSDAWYRISQLQQMASWTGSRHSLKFGGEYFPANSTGRLETFFGGQFIFGEYIPLGLILNSLTGDPNFSKGLGSAITAVGKPALLSSLSDPINSLQAFSFGLPVAYIEGFGNPFSSGTQQRAAFFVEDTYRPLPNLVLNYGLRYQFDSFVSVPTMNTWAPRFGFVWSPRFSDKLAIRGSFGLYHSLIESFIIFSATAFTRSDLNVLFVPLTGVPGVNNPATGLPVTSADIYESLLARGILGTRPIAYSDLTPLGVNPALRFPTTGGVAPDFRNPYSEQASLEIEREFGSFPISVGWNFSRVLRLPRTRDRNLKQVGTNPNGTPVFGLVDPAVLHNYILESTAKSFYSALVVQVNRRLVNHVALQAYYTLSRTTDEVTDFNIDYAPDNQLNARADRGLSAFHEKHRFVANAALESPYHRNSGTTGWLLADWTFSPILSAHSFRPFNILTGYDTLGDGQANTHRPLGAGRNIGRGPNFFSLDARLTRIIPISADGQARLIVIAEAFNLLNRTNFLTVNNIVGSLPLSALPQPLTGLRGDPTQPLSYTSASDARQFQFGLKVEF